MVGVRRMIGAVGLVVAPIAGLLTLLALATDPSGVPGFLLVTVLALGAWAQGISALIGLPIRVTFSWLGALALIAAAALTIVVIVAGVLGGLGLGTEVAGGAAIGLVGLIGTAWARGRPDRQMIPRSLGRATMGRVEPGDFELLAAGPGPILRRRAVVGTDRADLDARLAAADARLAADSQPIGRADDRPPEADRSSTDD